MKYFKDKCFILQYVKGIEGCQLIKKIDWIKVYFIVIDAFHFTISLTHLSSNEKEK